MEGSRLTCWHPTVNRLSTITEYFTLVSSMNARISLVNISSETWEVVKKLMKYWSLYWVTSELCVISENYQSYNYETRLG